MVSPPSVAVLADSDDVCSLPDLVALDIDSDDDEWHSSLLDADAIRDFTAGNEPALGGSTAGDDPASGDCLAGGTPAHTFSVLILFSGPAGRPDSLAAQLRRAGAVVEEVDIEIDPSPYGDSGSTARRANGPC